VTTPPSRTRKTAQHTINHYANRRESQRKAGAPPTYTLTTPLHLSHLSKPDEFKTYTVPGAFFRSRPYTSLYTLWKGVAYSGALGIRYTSRCLRNMRTANSEYSFRPRHSTFRSLTPPPRRARNADGYGQRCPYEYHRSRLAFFTLIACGPTSTAQPDNIPPIPPSYKFHRQ